MRRPASRSAPSGTAVHGGRMEQPSEHARTYTGQDMDMARYHIPQPHCGAATASTNHCRCRRCRCCHCCHCSSCRCSCHCCSLLPVTRRWKRRKSSAKHGPLRVATSIARCFAERGPNFSAPIGPPQADRERSFSAPQAERKFHRYLPRRSSLEEHISRPFCASKIPVHTGQQMGNGRRRLVVGFGCAAISS